MARPPSAPRFFATPAALRAWFATHHASESDLLVGFWRKESGRRSITWPESVDEALCVGWIDGVRRRLDDERYVIRFTPRKATSTWSTVNIGRMEALLQAGRVRPAGVEAYERRIASRTGIYAYEQEKPAALDAASEALFRRNRAAWAFFESRPPGYRRTAIWRVVSAKREETRNRRLAQLIEWSAKKQTIPELTRTRAQ